MTNQDMLIKSLYQMNDDLKANINILRDIVLEKNKEILTTFNTPAEGHHHQVPDGEMSIQKGRETGGQIMEKEMKERIKKQLSLRVADELINAENVTGDKRLLYGDAKNITGDVSCISGNVSYITGSVTGIRGCVSGITGSVTGITGDVSYIAGNVTGIRGDVTGVSGYVKDIVEILNEA